MLSISEDDIKKNWTPSENGLPVVSIQCMAFNHEAYIADALESFLMQKTDFPFEIVVHDDASTDRTADIIREYEKKFPGIIKALYETENQWSKGSLKKIIAPYLKGKYLAVCEGDDYWTDIYKLQKQVNYLESHRELSCVCCRYERYSENTKERKLEPDLYFDIPENSKKDSYVFDLKYIFFRQWITKTLTMLYRKEIYDKASQIITKKNFSHNYDIHIVYYTLKFNKGACLNFTGGVYRVHDTNVWGHLTEEQKFISRYRIYQDFKKKERSFIIWYTYFALKADYILNYSQKNKYIIKKFILRLIKKAVRLLKH